MPVVGIFGEQPVGRRAPFGGNLDQCSKMLALVIAGVVDDGAALQPLVGDGDGLARDIESGAVAKRRIEPKARNLVAQVPAKVFIVNENGDWFWLQWSEWRTIRHFLLYRLGLSGARAVPTLARLAVFPFTLLYLIGYAAAAHARRALRS